MYHGKNNFSKVFFKWKYINIVNSSNSLLKDFEEMKIRVHLLETGSAVTLL